MTSRTIAPQSSTCQYPEGITCDNADIYEPNMGRCARQYEPVDTAWMFPDADEAKEVFLRVANNHPDPKGRHWMLGWWIRLDGEAPHMRMLQIVHEWGHFHYTNWGPMTKSSAFPEPGVTAHLHLAVMDRTKRKALEAIAARERVRRPDGEWNCQDWIESVLEKAVEQSVLPKTEVEDVLERARCWDPRMD